MERQIRFCTTPQGVCIAYAVIGSGPAIVQVPPWVTHLELMWQIPEYRAYIEELARYFTVVTVEKRGNGLSDRGMTDFSPEARLSDLESVVDDLRLKRFALDGYSEGGPTSIMYAVKHPRQVSRMVLTGTFARGDLMFGTRDLQAATMALVSAEWGLGASTLTELFLGGDAPQEFRDAFAGMQRTGCTKEDARLSMEANFALDIRDLLPKVRVPTLVMHARDDRIVPIELGREIASGIRGAQFVSRDGGHVPVEPGAMDEMRRIATAFLMEDLADGAPKGESRAADPPARPAAGGFQTILFTDMEASTATTQRLGDAAAQDVVRAHNTAVRQALAGHGGAEIKHTGDGIMASFGAASRAVECAIAIQRALAAREGSPRVRIGVNAGEPVAEDDPSGRADLFGTAVQLAARACAKAEPGQIVVSNVIRELTAGKGFLFADLGDVALRGFEDPVRLYEVRWAQ